MKQNERITQQIEELDTRLGKGVGASKERAKLQKLLSKTQTKGKKDVANEDK